ncbi:hypothetical protein GCM10007071_10330 [Marinobacter zhanjiangensis]|uniref:Uncharacterized protein n=1 Tax=Marinobacter zhanjiangensis TaxID=578215 RepID=A0ABQ3ARE8_9GAMM|nr:hypothetical protein GCM10007071_10330 [Marinobacter zhanjiangensis]
MKALRPNRVTGHRLAGIALQYSQTKRTTIATMCVILRMGERYSRALPWPIIVAPPPSTVRAVNRYG